MFFINDLYRRGFSPATITAKISAISFIHQIYGKPDPAKHFLIRKFLCNLRKSYPHKDACLPITPNMLLAMLQVVPKLALSAYDRIMYQAMFLLSYAAILRPGEVTGSLHAIQYQNVKFADKTIVIRFSSTIDCCSINYWNFNYRIKMSCIIFCNNYRLISWFSRNIRI